MKICNWIKRYFCHKDHTISFEKEDVPTSSDYTMVIAFEHTWNLVDFARKHGKMQIGKFPEVNNRESFWVCQFVNEAGKCTPVRISSRLQGITSQEISKQKDKLKVGQLSNGKFVLFDFRSKKWEDVDLSL